ncbi:hypothetical protein D4741_20025 [Pseudoalteromonas gelatinilytica]|uniref:Type I restriction modification DNA specificity domain-containing protein n=1 Tax=Pseudoalteromonas gelatinilytica TaxID=1703256 RepID=A0A3A3EKR8_9GAMM|nr:restriction endonuclease subunit S [Pseudoalteromonas profundi]RJF32061.1 hypothetical protein D4741_20025 [Pseudoalteromonas profundi]
MIKFRDFTIDELFVIKKGRRLDRNKIPHSAFNGKYPYVSRTERANMVSDWIDYDEYYLSPGNVLALGMDTFVFTYQPVPFFTGDKIKIAILRNHELNEAIALYLITSIRKVMASLKWGVNMDEDKLKKISIELPITERYEPDWDYMENYIENIQKGILSSEIKSYVNQLAEEIEWSVLEEKRVFSDFLIGTLFNIKPTKNYGMTNDDLFKKAGSVPVISNISFNNGAVKYIDLEPTEKAGILTFSDTGTYATKSVFYQPVDFIGYSHVQGMYPLFNPSFLTENVGLYFVTAIRKAVDGVYDYSRKFTRESVMETIIELPIDENGKPDWVYMEKYIKAIKGKISISRLGEYSEVHE